MGRERLVLGNLLDSTLYSDRHTYHQGYGKTGTWEGRQAPTESYSSTYLFRKLESEPVSTIEGRTWKNCTINEYLTFSKRGGFLYLLGQNLEPRLH